jgi:DNA-binding transcriptional ArsR family regulator
LPPGIAKWKMLRRRNFHLTGKHLLTYYLCMTHGHRRTSARSVFAAVGDPTRRRVLDLLSRGELPVRQIAAPFSMTRPAISQHLRILLGAGLVVVRRSGRERYYRLHARPLRQVYEWVAHYERFWSKKLKSLGAYLDRQEKRGR